MERLSTKFSMDEKKRVKGNMFRQFCIDTSFMVVFTHRFHFLGGKIWQMRMPAVLWSCFYWLVWEWNAKKFVGTRIIHEERIGFVCVPRIWFSRLSAPFKNCALLKGVNFLMVLSLWLFCSIYISVVTPSVVTLGDIDVNRLD